MLSTEEQSEVLALMKCVLQWEWKTIQNLDDNSFNPASKGTEWVLRDGTLEEGLAKGTDIEFKAKEAINGNASTRNMDSGKSAGR